MEKYILKIVLLPIKPEFQTPNILTNTISKGPTNRWDTKHQRKYILPIKLLQVKNIG